MIRMTKVLVPTDFSEPSRKALAYGQALASAFGASLHVLHAVEEPLTQGWTGYGVASVLPGLREEAMSEAQRRLDDAVPASVRDAQPTELVIRVGDPFAEIVRFARERGADVIVMGTHGRGGMAHLLLGSVAERVVRTAPCPVLTVREKEHEFVVAERTA
jgi:nucleotide-binding universal stress UspA family protein